MKSIEEARAEVHSAFESALAFADSGQQRSFFEFERQLWTLILALGRALVALFLARQVARPRTTEYQHKKVSYCLDGERTTPIGTRFGKVPFARPIGRMPNARQKKADLPIDRELGLCSGFSLGVVLAVARLCAQMSFASARATFRDTYEWSPSSRATLRMVDALGDQARPFLEQAPPPADDGEILVIQVDGKGAPMISSAEHERRRKPHRRRQGCHRAGRRLQRRQRPRKRRTKGKKSKNAKVAVVGVLYTLKRTPDGIEGPIGKRLYATFDSHEALFIWLRREADKRGYGRKQSLFLADGYLPIWDLQKRYFADAEVCLDWYHVVEKLWEAGECFYAEGSEELRTWIAVQTRLLRRGAIRVVIQMLRAERAKIPKTGPGNRGKRERLDDIINHFAKHKGRMQYHKLRRRNLDIGSGAVEGAVRNLVGMRFDGPGMRWSRGRSERLLHLRCILLNDQWEEFGQYAAHRKAIPLPAQPIATITHDAKQKCNYA